MADETDVSGSILDQVARGDPTYKADKDPQTTTSVSTRSSEAGAVSQQPGGQSFSRRELLRWAGILGAAAALPGCRSSAPITVAESVQEPLRILTATELNTLEAIVARLIPTDENGPGATEARAAHYIAQALAGPLGALRAAYSSGLASVNSYAQVSKAATFSKLSAKDQDAVLSDIENDIATGFGMNSSAFFDLLRMHTIQGTFSDPYYGGNANFVGWDLIRYPGIRIVVTADEQRMETNLTPNHKSAYDDEMFSKQGV